MLVRRLSQVGTWLLSEVKHVVVTAASFTLVTLNSSGQVSSIPRRFHIFTNSYETPPHHYWKNTRHPYSTANEDNQLDNQKISVTFIEKDGEEKLIKVPVGMSMLEAAHAHDIELEGACEGSVACSTCHVIVEDVEFYNKLEEPTDEENDMLDLAFGLTQMSRLGCQIIASPELDGVLLALPSAARNFAVDGYVPKPH